jgi:transcriptional regulator with XRE-family HTH domain
MISNEECLRNLAANVSRLMDQQGLTQKQLAERIGEHQVTISRVRRGLNMPGIGLLKRIAVALDTSCDVLTDEPKRSAF